ncbi:acyl-CoA dehydrogenase family protein [Pseudonocardia xishanensis]|uniref:Acyl-CoA dehydrogenase family protein n=1 Tax=Pseudonocardia xishanensis TaxID=630995 RepID=A0ABP8RV48_9PSEU
MIDEVAEVRAAARSLAEEWLATGGRGRADNWARGLDPAFSKSLAAHGLIGLTWPREYGGRGLGNVARLAVTEELLRVGAPTGAHWVGDRQIGPSLIRHGTERQRAEFLPAIIAGEVVFALGMSEPGAGSDLAAVTTRATPVAGGFRVSGRKVWTSNAHRATHLYLLARTDTGERKHEGLSEFLIDMDSPGVQVSPIRDLAGEHHFNEVLLEGVVVPEDRLLGVRGRGWQQVVGQLAFERGGPERVLSTYPLLAELLSAGLSLSPAEQDRLGELIARLAALRHLAGGVAKALDGGEAPTREAAGLKHLGTAFETDLAEFVRDAYAATGRAPSPLVWDALLSSPGFGIRGGAAEVLLSLIARQEARA